MSLSDPALVREFVENRSESAFDALVRRHVDMVHSAATRITGDRHLAEDVAQAVFLALARQASDVVRKLDQGMPLTAWLHLTTRNVAAKAVRSEARRRAREQQSSAMQSDEVRAEPDRSEWDRIAAHLDGTLGELSDADRCVVFLRFFEGRTAREIGGQLGIGEEAAQKRVLRAIDRLRSHLDRHAPGLASTTLAALLGTWSVQKAPAALAIAVVQGALGGLGTVAPLGVVVGLRDAMVILMTTKNQVLATGVLLTALALPIAHQAREIQEARRAAANVVAVRAESPTTPSVVSGVAAGAGNPEASETASLTARADELRALIAVRKAAISPPPPADIAEPAGPLMLRPGVAVSVADLVVAGTKTPEATVQTLLTLMRNGDLDATLGLLLMGPDERAEADATFLQDPAARDVLLQRMRSEFEAIRSIELTDVESIAERRSVVTLRRVTSTGTNELRMTLGRTASGWKQVM